MDPAGVSTRARASELLLGGTMALLGRVVWSSNNTFLVVLRSGGDELLAVYKPRLGERPLWDFEAGTLCQREVAAYVLSESLGWPDIPITILRDGPFGVGSVQQFVEADPEAHFYTMRETPACAEALKAIALFDAVVNNADRKGGHVLLGGGGRVWAIDHGLTFHTEPKLRTVIWEYVGQPIDDAHREDLLKLEAALGDKTSELCVTLARLVTPDEILATVDRVRVLVQSGVYPLPSPERRNVPYPLI